MGKSIWDTRFGKRGMAQDEYVQVEEGDSWKTIHGAHVLLGDDGRIKAGAEGKFNGIKLNKSERPSKEQLKKHEADLSEKRTAAARTASESVQGAHSEVKKAMREARMQATLDYLNQYEESNPPKSLEKPMSEEEAINRIAGGDETEGSCASAAMAYIANQILGLDARDFRGGVSQIAMSCAALDALEELQESGINSSDGYNPNKDGGGIFQRASNNNLIENTMRCFESMKPGEPYVAIIGEHMALVRRTDDPESDEVEYLELQSSIMRSPGGPKTIEEYEHGNGWKTLVEDSVMYSNSTERRKEDLNEKLEKRFGIGKDEWSGSLQGIVPASRFAETDCMKKLLPYVNTSEGKQQKGSGGSIK